MFHDALPATQRAETVCGFGCPLPASGLGEPLNPSPPHTPLPRPSISPLWGAQRPQTPFETRMQAAGRDSQEHGPQARPLPGHSRDTHGTPDASLQEAARSTRTYSNLGGAASREPPRAPPPPRARGGLPRPAPWPPISAARLHRASTPCVHTAPLRSRRQGPGSPAPPTRSPRPSPHSRSGPRPRSACGPR